ncbi:MAG: glycosyltransferase family 2 protein [Acidimicrobiia bacterium]
MSSTPTLSIGLPVYNGADLLPGALDSLLEQDFTDFELILSDNGSTDSTPEICEKYAQDDARITFLRGTRNVGAARNYNRTFDLASGRYFKWAAHDDRYEPAFLRRCVEVLEARPEVVLVYAQATDVGPNGEDLGPVDFECDTFGPDPVRRFMEVIRRPHPCFQVFGVMRSDVMANTILHGSYTGADRVLLAQLALCGPWVEVAERLFLHGEHPDRSVNAYEYEHQRYGWFDPRLQGKVAFPNWRMLGEYGRVVKAADIAPAERRRAYQALAGWAGQFRVDLARDLARPIRRKLTRR